MVKVILRSYLPLRRKQGMSCGGGVAGEISLQDAVICVRSL
jgi:hypothetical protein